MTTTTTTTLLQQQQQQHLLLLLLLLQQLMVMMIMMIIMIMMITVMMVMMIILIVIMIIITTLYGLKPHPESLSFFYMVLPTGHLSVLPWEWHMEATDFCLPETQSESQGAPLNMGWMRCWLANTTKVHDKCKLAWRGGGGGGKGGGIPDILWIQAASRITYHVLKWWCYQQDLCAFCHGNGILKGVTSVCPKHSLSLRMHYSKWGRCVPLAHTTIVHKMQASLWERKKKKK